jgi:hypothetical protein
MEVFTKADERVTLSFVFDFKMGLIKTNHKMRSHCLGLKYNQSLYLFPFRENLRMEKI